MEAAITEELIARQPPEAQAIIRLLLVKIAALERENGELKTRLEELERQAKGKTPRIPRCRPARNIPMRGRSRRGTSRRRNVAGSPATRNTSDP